MSDRNLARLSVSLALAYVALAIVAIVLALRTESNTGTVSLMVGSSGFTVVGSLLAARRPRNPIGWLFVCAALALAADKVLEGLTIYGLVTVPGSVPLVLVAYTLVSWCGSAGVLLLVLALLVFPTGRLPSLRWRGVAIACGLFTLLVQVLGTLGLDHLGPAYPELKNPTLIPAVAPIAETLAPIFTFSTVPVLLGAPVVSLLSRYRSAPSIEKQQLKWVVLAAVVMVALLGAASTSQELIPLSWPVALNILPAAVGIAILRYRLFDIDHLINRTLVYGATTGVIAILFFAGILALQQLLRPLTSGSELAIAASTLVAFALFQPIRRRVQDAVDRRFDRSRYDAARTLDAFTEDLRDEVDLDDLKADLIGAVRRTMSPAHASIWLREGRR